MVDYLIVIAGLGGIARLKGELEQAARLLGAASIAFENSIGLQTRPDFERDVTAVREQFGSGAFEAAWTQGRAMTIEQALRLGGSPINPGQQQNLL